MPCYRVKVKTQIIIISYPTSDTGSQISRQSIESHVLLYHVGYKQKSWRVPHNEEFYHLVANGGNL